MSFPTDETHYIRDRLIAAAPDLLEAARVADGELCRLIASQGWVEALNSGDPGNVTEWMGPGLNRALCVLRAAIAKAEGGSSDE